MKKILVILLAAIIPLALCSCAIFAIKELNEYSYYSDVSNYESIRATVDEIHYKDDESRIIINVSDIEAPSTYDSSFRIKGANYNVVIENGIMDKLAEGDEIEIVSAPAYFGDGYIYPIVSLTVGDEELLSFDVGVENLKSTFFMGLG